MSKGKIGWPDFWNRLPEATLSVCYPFTWRLVGMEFCWFDPEGGTELFDRSNCPGLPGLLDPGMAAKLSLSQVL